MGVINTELEKANERTRVRERRRQDRPRPARWRAQARQCACAAPRPPPPAPQCGQPHAQPRPFPRRCMRSGRRAGRCGWASQARGRQPAPPSCSARSGHARPWRQGPEYSRGLERGGLDLSICQSMGRWTFGRRWARQPETNCRRRLWPAQGQGCRESVFSAERAEEVQHIRVSQGVECACLAARVQVARHQLPGRRRQKRRQRARPE